MGLSKSKHKPRKGEEQKKGRIYTVPKPKEKQMDRRSQESDAASDTKPADSSHGKKGAAKRHQLSSSEVEEPADVAANSSKKKVVIPRIVITRASKETLRSYSSVVNEEQRTIQEQVEWGPYYRHRSPSTADAYGLQE